MPQDSSNINYKPALQNVDDSIVVATGISDRWDKFRFPENTTLHTYLWITKLRHMQ